MNNNITETFKSLLEFNRLKIIKNKYIGIHRYVLLSMSNNCSLYELNNTYENIDRYKNSVINIYNHILVDNEESFESLKQNYKNWVINHAICSLVEELYLLYLEILHLDKINGMIIKSNLIISDLIKKNKNIYYENSNEYRNFQAAFDKVHKLLDINSEHINCINSYLKIRNCITHDDSKIVNKIYKKQKAPQLNKIDLKIFTLKFEEAGRQKTDSDYDQIKLRIYKEENTISYDNEGDAISIDYECFNNIFTTFVNHVNEIEKALIGKYSQPKVQ